jgi:glycerophosphoryl diester phosphodiesterase
MTAGRPLLIAHGYANSRKGLNAALSSPADMIEADLWYRGGRIWARHERRLPLLPILSDRWSGQVTYSHGPRLRLGPWFLSLDLHPFGLEEMLSRVNARRPLLLDLKGRHSTTRARAFCALLLDYLQRFGMSEKAWISGEWRLLDEVRRAKQGMPVYYSVGNRGQWRALVRRIEKGDEVKGVCIHRALVDDARVRFLQMNGVEFYCWAIENRSDARRLIELGAAGIISFDLHLLSSL